MDLESESSALESVDDNSLNQQIGMNDGTSLDYGSCSDDSVKLLSTCTDKIDDAAASFTPISKGTGLRKWRRIRRDLVKHTSRENTDNTKLLKRDFSGSDQQILFQSPELDSQGSFGSVNTLKSSGDGYDSMISSGQRGKIRVENSKKLRGESVEIEKENSHSSLESDSRKQTGRMMDYNGHGDEEGEGEGSIDKNRLYSEELDPLTEAINGFLALQEALEKEVQQFSVIGKEPIDHEGSSPCSEIVTLVHNAEQLETKLGETKSMLEVKESHIRELESTTNQNETVVEDIFKQRIESEIEYLIYSRSIDNLNSQIKSVKEEGALAEEEAHETLNKLGEVETKAKNISNRAKVLRKECRETNGTIKKSACKTISYFVIQLVLVLFFVSQLLPESDIVVVPT